MSHGLINAVVVTPANVADPQALPEICPGGGMVFADKGHSAASARDYLISRGCHAGVILKNNMQAFVPNLKRLIKIETDPIPLLDA